MAWLIRIAPAFVLASCALAAEPAWLKVRSQNFELFTTSSEKKGREAVLYFEQVRGFFLEVNRWTDESRLPVRIVAFSGEEQYRPFRANDFSSAYYASSGDEDWIVMRSIEPQNYPVAVHEYSHVALRRAGLKLPPWLSEGLAELQSTLRPSGKRAEIGHFLPARAQVLADRRWIDLASLTSASHDSPLYTDRRQAGIFYAESWALTHMLVLSERYRDKFRPFLRAVISGAGSSAFEQAYGKTLEEVQRDLANYVGANVFPTASFPTKLSGPAEEPEVRPVTELELGMTLAGLLAAQDKLDEARTRYADLARRFPQEPSVEEALAALELRAARRDEARRHLARAGALGSRKPDVFFDYAMLLSEAGAGDAEISAPLRRAVELKPDFDRARFFLGLALLNQGHDQESLDVLIAVKAIEPRRASTLERAKGWARYALGDLEQARKDAAQALALAQTEKDKTSAEALMKVLSPPGLQPDSGPKRVAGAFDELECLGKAVRISIIQNGRRLSFEVPDLEKIQITGGAFDFRCGAQDGRLMIVRYELDGAARHVTGIELQ